MNISGIVVHASPDRIGQVCSELENIPGVEIHAVSPEGKMVVTIEKIADQEISDTFEQIARLAGVLSSAMVYHHFEADPKAA